MALASPPVGRRGAVIHRAAIAGTPPALAARAHLRESARRAAGGGGARNVARRDAVADGRLVDLGWHVALPPLRVDTQCRVGWRQVLLVVAVARGIHAVAKRLEDEAHAVASANPTIAWRGRVVGRHLGAVARERVVRTRRVHVGGVRTVVAGQGVVHVVADHLAQAGAVRHAYEGVSKHLFAERLGVLLAGRGGKVHHAPVPVVVPAHDGHLAYRRRPRLRCVQLISAQARAHRGVGHLGAPQPVALVHAHAHRAAATRSVPSAAERKLRHRRTPGLAVDRVDVIPALAVVVVPGPGRRRWRRRRWRHQRLCRKAPWKRGSFRRW